MSEFFFLCLCVLDLWMMFSVFESKINRSIEAGPLSDQLRVVVHELFTPPLHQQTDFVISGFNQSWSRDNCSMQREQKWFLWRHKTSITPHNICSHGHATYRRLQTHCCSNSSRVWINSCVVNKVWCRGEALLMWRLITWQQLLLCVSLFYGGLISISAV